MNASEKKLKQATAHLQAAIRSLTSAKKRATKKRKNPCNGCSKNPRVHFPKTKRGRKEKSKTWKLTAERRPPIRFKATKSAAYKRATKYAKSYTRVVLDDGKR